ncbi:hypothetical protein L873DRAFT_1833068 [Choiromyces venosus 120613-1]|uniref:Uncharacterized protein n=1 Tax=Choiromyces venosus 120613-1 TaxID=1336337 RepID=A0A3N4KEP5_9PEZI|nr:hypothetical protein L873DRAFT_1833068 [Choiromyces venosus 120613-1]
MSFLHSRKSTIPPVFAPAETKKDTPAIPDPQVFTITTLQPAASGLPTVSQCAVHLELLEAFTRLRNRVYKEEAFSELFGEDPEKKLWWRAVVEVAVGRFGIWWETVNEELKVREEGEAGMLDKSSGMKVLPRDLLPPLDVLMVWHSYMLNPRKYNEDCIWFGMGATMDIAFPYEYVHEAIDDDKWDYKLSGHATRYWEKISSQAPDILEEILWKLPPKKTIKCPACAKEMEVFMCEIKPENRKRGWISEEFAVDCEGCGMDITMESLCAEKFRKDIKSLIEDGEDFRLRITSLDLQGATYLHPSSPTSFDVLNSLNALIRTTFPEPPTLQSHPTIASIIAPLSTHPVTPLLQSCYAETPTPYSLNLTLAVLRQGSFVDKMHQQLWIRSPSLMGRLPLDSIPLVRARPETRSVVLINPPDTSGFLQRAVSRYKSYFSLFKLHPGKILVPTIDVDLVWHSAMLTPVAYRAYCKHVAGRFIDHNDKLSEDTLDDGFEYTAAAFEEITGGEEYGRCLCWHCETALNEGVRPGGGKEERWKVWKVTGDEKERLVRLRVEYYREVEKRRRSRMEGLGREGLFAAMKRK